MQPEDRVWAPHRRGLAVGLVLTITTLAFEALGVSTAMPVVARELDGVELYGWAFTAALLGSLVGIALAGGSVDRRGPGAPFLVGLALFTIGIVGAGAASSMEMLVAARFVQGLGVGVVPSVVYASMGRAFGDRGRARMFALLSSAWVVPGLIGPAISGTVAESIGWRWVFFGILPLVAVNVVLAAPPLLRLGPPPDSVASDAGHRRTVVLAVVLASGVAMAVAGLNDGRIAATPITVTGLMLAAVTLRRLLPGGTFVARAGLPAAIATKALATMAFFTAQSFLPLVLTDLRGERATVAGLALTLSTVTWTAGAWLQDKRGHIWGRKAMVGRGVAIMLVGIASSGSVVVASVPAGFAALSWAIAGLGMGMAYGGLSLIVLAEAAPGQEGRASSAMQLAEQVSIAVGTGLAGAAVAAGERADRLRPGLAVAFVIATLAAAATTAAAGRLRSGAGSAHAEELVAPALGLVPDALDD